MSAEQSRGTVRRLVPAPLLRVKRHLQRPRDLARSIERIRSFGAARTPDEAWRMHESYEGWGDFAHIHATQLQCEITQLLELLKTERVRTACEIGSFQGGTLFMMTRILPDDARIFSVDWPEAPGSLGSFPRERKALYEAFARPGQSVIVIHGNSREPATIGTLKQALGGTSLDFLMIDGDHSYEGVKADFENYAGLVRKGGLIAFHDIAGSEENTLRVFNYAFGVGRFWREVSEDRRAVEFVDPECWQHRNGGGIGVVWWDGA